MKLIALCLLLLAVSGCRVFTPPASQDEVKGATWMQYDATRRGGFLIDQSSTNRRALIAENSPDVASSITAELVAKTKGVEISGKLAENLLELGKRTETVMILRESLYRLAELTNNAQLDATASAALYKQVLQAITLLSLAEHSSSQADIARAIADALRSSASAHQEAESTTTTGSSASAPGVAAAATFLDEVAAERSGTVSAEDIRRWHDIAVSYESAIPTTAEARPLRTHWGQVVFELDAASTSSTPDFGRVSAAARTARERMTPWLTYVEYSGDRTAHAAPPPPVPAGVSDDRATAALSSLKQLLDNQNRLVEAVLAVPPPPK